MYCIDCQLGQKKVAIVDRVAVVERCSTVAKHKQNHSIHSVSSLITKALCIIFILLNVKFKARID